MKRQPKNAAHTMEGRNRKFNKAAPVSTLFETAEEIEARDALHRKLQFFPTQPWAVRALLHVLREQGHPFFDYETPHNLILEPCAGRGHIVMPLREAGFVVRAADIHDFGKGYEVRDFLAERYVEESPYDAVITNPPFSDDSTKNGDPGLAHRIVMRGLDVAPEVFVLCRLGFLSTVVRCRLHTRYLTDVYVNTERCDMVLGRYDPQASTATDSAWYRFRRDKPAGQLDARIHFIPPGLKARLTKPEDVRI